jgi:hypothetical protein
MKESTCYKKALRLQAKEIIKWLYVETHTAVSHEHVLCVIWVWFQVCFMIYSLSFVFNLSDVFHFDINFTFASYFWIQFESQFWFWLILFKNVL